MAFSEKIELIYAHCSGEIGNVAVSGIPPIPGKTLAAKMDFINRSDNRLLRYLVHEPRGKAQMSVNLLLPKTLASAHAAFMILQPDGAYAMSGSNCICVATVLLETGLVEMTEPFTRLNLETPAGLIEVKAECKKGKCLRAELRMPPAFVERLEHPLRLENGKILPVDIVYGGVFYALADVRRLGLKISRENAGELTRVGLEIKRTLNRSLQVSHPRIPEIQGIGYVMFTDTEELDGEKVLKNCTVMSGRVDRSPCGTGSNARLAAMYARGEMALGETKIATSITGGVFELTLLDEIQTDFATCVQCSVSGSAWIYGQGSFHLDAEDPFPLGITPSDLWEAKLSNPNSP